MWIVSAVGSEASFTQPQQIRNTSGVNSPTSSEAGRENAIILIIVELKKDEKSITTEQ